MLHMYFINIVSTRKLHTIHQIVERPNANSMLTKQPACFPILDDIVRNTIPIKRVKHFQLFNVLITAEHCCDPVEGWITGIPNNFFFSILGFRLKRTSLQQGFADQSNI